MNSGHAYQTFRSWIDRPRELFILRKTEPHSPDRFVKFVWGFSAAYFAVVSAFVLLSVFDMPRGLGAEELAWTIAQSYQENRFLDLSTWLSYPLPFPQFVHVSLKRLLDLLGLENFLIQSILLVNATALSLSAVLIYLIGKRFLSPSVAMLGAFASLAAQTPMHSSIAGGSTSLAIIFAIGGIYLSLRAIEAKRYILFAALAGLCLSISTMSRIEAVFIAAPIALLLFTQRGWRPSLVFCLFGGAYFFAEEYLSQYLLAGHQPYSQYAEHYLHDSTLTIAQWLNAPLISSGLFENFPVIFSIAATPFALLCLASKKYRFLSLLWLSAALPIFYTSYSGAIVVTRPYYLAFAGALMVFPLACALDYAVVKFGDRVTVRKRTIFAAILSLAIGVQIFGAMRSYEDTTKSNNIYASAAAIKVALVNTLENGDSVFSDHTFYWSAYFANHSFSAGADDIYTYLRYCCLSEKAAQLVEPRELERLTSNKSHVLPHLEIESKQFARLLWGHGFIEQHNPTHFVLMNSALYEVWKAKPWNTGETASFIYPYITETRQHNGKTVHFVELKYSNAKFCLYQLAKSESFSLFRAAYEQNSQPVRSIADCPMSDSSA